MLGKIWTVIKAIGRFLRGLFVFVFFAWMALSIIEIKQEITTIQDQNLQAYNVQAEVFSKIVSTINALATYAQGIEQADRIRAATLAEFLQQIDNKIKEAEEKAKEADEASLKRDTIIATAFQKYTEQPTYDYMKSMIVYLIQQDLADTTHGSIGTGTVIKVTDSETYILTNKHVCDFSEGTVCYAYQDKQKYMITLVKRNTVDHDIQIVKTSRVIPGKQPVKGLKDVAPQDKVYMVGHNRGNPFMYSEGTVSGFIRESGDLLVGMPSGPGNSGSVIFTHDGYLCGLLFAGQVMPFGPYGSLDTAHGICVNSKILRLFLDGYVS